MSAADDINIDLLAEAVGIEDSYRDVDGRIRKASGETKRGLLKAMGHDVSLPAAVRDALEGMRADKRKRILAPVIVSRRTQGAAGTVALTLPENPAQGAIDWQIDSEGGEMLSGSAAPADLRAVRRQLVDGVAIHRVGLPLPPDLPDGYHRLTIAAAGTTMTTRLIAAPAAGYMPSWLEHGERRWGVACPLFSLWSETSWGIGDFSDLGALGSVAGRFGATTIGLNPLHAPLAGDPADVNPYWSSSRLFIDPTHIDVASLLSQWGNAETISLLQEPAFGAALALARAAPLVDHAAVRRLKHQMLRTIHRSFGRSEDDTACLLPAGPFRDDFQRFLDQQGDRLIRFAVFCALEEVLAPLRWHDWPTELRTPGGTGVAAFARTHADRVAYHLWLQWIADRQLAGAAAAIGAAADGAALYRDLAVGINPDGADAWADQQIYVAHARFGAPPDAFNPAGQDWGTPPPHPAALRAQGYAPFVAALRANMRHARNLRIDHVMALRRLYWIPPGAPPDCGGYVRYPFDDLLGVLALESRRNQCLIIGEDLGTVPDGFRDTLAQAGVLSYRVLMFERYEDGLFRRPSIYPRLAVATAGTHDLPSLKAWWEGRDLELRRALQTLSADDALSAVRRRAGDRALLIAALRDQQLVPAEFPIGDGLDADRLKDFIEAIERFVARTPSALVMANLGDLLAEAEQINVPGTVSEHPNWRHRFRVSVSAISMDGLVSRLLRAIAAERAGAARSPE